MKLQRGVATKPLIVKISSRLSVAVFDCRIYRNCLNVYLTSAVKCNLVKFLSGSVTQTCSAIQSLVDT